MDSPKREDYLMSNGNYSFNYTEELEKYCDELEEWLIYTERVAEVNQESADRTELLEIENEKLNKALDKACEKLAFTSNKHIIEELGSFTLGEINRTKEEWREWCLKDE